MGCIYIIKNTVNDKVYIGQTVSPLSKRWAAHLYAARTYGSTKLYVNMRKVGIENFFVEKITNANDDELNELEVKYILEYNSINDGYNTQLGGTSIRTKLSPYIDDIIFDYICGYSSMEISKQYNCSDETILNILKAHGVEIRNHNRKIICVNTGEVYNSFVEAAKFIMEQGACKTNNIYNVASEINYDIKNGYKAYGYNFMYYDEYVNNGFAKELEKDNKEGTIIELLNADYEYQDIADELNMTKDAVRMYCKRHGLTKSRSKLNAESYLLSGNNFRVKFNTLKEMAEWVISNKLTKSTSVKDVQYRLGIALKNNKKMMDMSVTIYDGENIFINKLKTHEGQKKSVKTLYNGKELTFSSMTDAARWMISNNLNKKHSRLYDISYNIGKACKENKMYEGLNWEYI